MVKKRYIISLSIILHGSILFAFTNLGASVRKPSAVNISFDFKQIPQKTKLNKAFVENNIKKTIAKIHTSQTTLNERVIEDKTDNSLDPDIAKLIKYVQPIYPDIARKKGIEASFEVNLTIDQHGNVTSVDVSAHTYLSLFKQSIEQALYNWKFASGGENKIFKVPVIFKLEE
jgi:TonB family protein